MPDNEGTTTFAALKIYGSVDRLGYLYCVACRPIIAEKPDRLVRGLPHSAERCDQCGATLNR